MSGRRGPRSPGPSRDDQREATFLRGLTIGALIGAALAGSALWSRLAGRVRRADGRGVGAPADRDAGGDDAGPGERSGAT